MMQPVRQVQIHHVRRHAQRTIKRRLGCDRNPADRAAVLLHVNSGGNVIAAENALVPAAYTVTDTGYDPWATGNYDVQLCVRPHTDTGPRPRPGGG